MICNGVRWKPREHCLPDVVVVGLDALSFSGAANDVRTAQQRERRAIVDVQFRRAFGSRREQRVTCDANDFEQPARGSGQLFDARTDDLLERDGRRRHAGRHLEVMQQRKIILQ